MTNQKQPEALRLADRLDLYATGDEHQRDTEAAAAELRLQHAELETLRAKLKTYEDLGDAGSDVQLLRMGYAAARLEIESLRASRGQAPAGAEEPGAAYAEMPTHSHAGRVYEEGFLIGTCPLYTADKMRAFADATHALRVAPHGQASAPLILNCKSEQKRLATLWGFVPAQADPLQPVVALQEIAEMYADDFKPQADRQPAPAAVAGSVVNRATVIEWLDANDIEVTDRQMDGLFHFAAPTTQPAHQQEPSCTSVQLAEMVLSDCGHSSNYTPLLDRVAARIDAHVERRLDELRGCLESRPLPAAQEGRERDMPIGALLPCPCCGGKATEYDRFNANRVSCNSCGLSVRQSEQGAGDAAQHWNRRAPQPSPAAQGDALDAARLGWLNPSDMEALERVNECAEDGVGYDVPASQMKRMAELGVVQSLGFGRYGVTSFGSIILGSSHLRKPLETVEECNSRLGREHQAQLDAARAAQEGKSHG